MRGRLGALGNAGLWHVSAAAVFAAAAALLGPLAPACSETVTVDPRSVAVERWQGWGCSLSWWAVYSSHWSEEARREACRRLFSRDRDALGLSICRYNAGGTAPDADASAFRLGGKVVVLLDRDGSWHPERDAAQIECLRLARRFGARTFELFVNSPPYWMLRNGNTRGGDGGRENLRPESHREYAAWLVTTVRRLEATCGVRFHSIAPLNEPSAWWWDGARGNQEGCCIPREAQASVLRFLDEEMERAGRRWTVAASDENGARDAYETLEWLTSPAVGGRGGGLGARHIQRVNVHAYQGWEWQDRLRELARRRGIPAIWMSEVTHREWENAGYVPDDTRCALPVTRSVVNDVRRLQCRAWVYWQPIEPLQYCLWYRFTYGLLQAAVDQDVEWRGRTYRPGDLVTARSFYALMQFTRFIRPGSRLLRSGDDWTLAALSPDRRRLVLVVHNDGTAPKRYVFDLSRFARCGRSARVWRTADGPFDCTRVADLRVRGSRFADEVPSRSVTTYVLDGMRQ